MKFGHTVVADFENQLQPDEKGCIPLDEQEVDRSFLHSGSKKGEEYEDVLSAIFRKKDQ